MNDTQCERILVMLPLCLEDTRMPSYLLLKLFVNDFAESATNLATQDSVL